MAAFRRRGRRVAAAKVGPDFIDPGYHALATDRPGRNLDPWMCGEDVVVRIAAKAASGCDLLVVEGVMGLFDGAGGGPVASTAHVARLLDAPVVLVVDARAMSGSVAAMVHGYASWDAHTNVAGVILNRVASDTHEAMLRQALAPVGIPVVGVLRREDGFTWRDRHLGLVPVVEHPDVIRASLDRVAAAVDAGCDLELIAGLASTAPAMPVGGIPCDEGVPVGRARIAVVGGPAFSFMYPDNLEALEGAGAELAWFDPLTAERVPEGATGLVVGGGFPEVYAEHLGANEPLLGDVRTKVRSGLTTWAECAGLLWLSRSLDGHAMAGAVDCDAHMTTSLTLGYRTATTTTVSPVGDAGTSFRGHEFHYSTVDPSGEAMTVGAGDAAQSGGFATPTLLATYVHVHLGGWPGMAASFVRAAT